MSSRGFACCVSKSATFVVEAKGPKTSDTPSCLIRYGGRKSLESGPTGGVYSETMPKDSNKARGLILAFVFRAERQASVSGLLRQEAFGNYLE